MHDGYFTRDMEKYDKLLFDSGFDEILCMRKCCQPTVLCQMALGSG